MIIAREESYSYAFDRTRESTQMAHDCRCRSCISGDGTHLLNHQPEQKAETRTMTALKRAEPGPPRHEPPPPPLVTLLRWSAKKERDRTTGRPRPGRAVIRNKGAVRRPPWPPAPARVGTGWLRMGTPLRQARTRGWEEAAAMSTSTWRAPPTTTRRPASASRFAFRSGPPAWPSWPVYPRDATVQRPGAWLHERLQNRLYPQPCQTGCVSSAPAPGPQKKRSLEHFGAGGAKKT
jgi:hypothetical protein